MSAVKSEKKMRLKFLLVGLATLSAVWLATMSPLPAYADEGGKGSTDTGPIAGVTSGLSDPVSESEPAAAQPSEAPLDAAEGATTYDTHTYDANTIDKHLADIRSQMLSVARECWPGVSNVSATIVTNQKDEDGGYILVSFISPNGTASYQPLDASTFAGCGSGVMASVLAARDQALAAANQE
jgi:hypothetical protein